MPVVIRRTFPPLDRVQLLTRSDWEAVGQMMRERIIARTEAGVDAEGRPFARYSPGYALQKGRELLGVEASASHVDLTVSGEMLRAITYEATENGVTLFFAR